jgi:trimethylamine-N-oxide reductase (cytochrome c)
LFAKYSLQLITSHPPYSFHTFGDGKATFINDVRDHRLPVGGYHYWILRIGPDDAQRRGLAQGDLVKVFNDRGTVICAVDISPLVAPGVVKAFESCAVYDEILTTEGPADRGGCLNLLTPSRVMSKTADGIAPNSCLVEVKKWDGVVLEAA